MRKLLLLVGAVALIAAACDSGPTTSYQPPAHQTKADTAVNQLNAQVDSEESISTQTDDDVISSDKAVINSYDGVSNASSY